MDFIEKLADVQFSLDHFGIDGWLLYDFRRSNQLATAFLEIPDGVILTRRFFYWIPKTGNPVKIVSAIEEKNLEDLPGEKRTYRTWKELENTLAQVLKGAQSVAMEYSAKNEIPYLSKVDAGTVEAVRSFGVKVVSSGDLLQKYTSVWDREKYQSHVEAAKILSETVAKAWQLIRNRLGTISESHVQQFILQEFEKKGCVCDDPPIVAVNAHSADPHYLSSETLIHPGDFILIDLSCKLKRPRSVYADITRVAVAAQQATGKQQAIFSLVKQAQDAALLLVDSRFREKKPLMGCEVDQVCRQVIEKGGYGEYFIHRTGHNLDEVVHGHGVNLDNYETNDRRHILPGMGFTIEPGIYLPGEFGVRLEYDVYIHPDGSSEVNGGVQDEILCLC